MVCIKLASPKYHGDGNQRHVEGVAVAMLHSGAQIPDGEIY